MTDNRYPRGWTQARVQAVAKHYENQTAAQAAEEDEAAFRKRGQTVIVVPNRLVPEITRLIERRQTARKPR